MNISDCVCERAHYSLTMLHQNFRGIWPNVRGVLLITIRALMQSYVGWLFFQTSHYEVVGEISHNHLAVIRLKLRLFNISRNCIRSPA